MTWTASAGLNHDGLLPSRASLPCGVGDREAGRHAASCISKRLRAHERAAEQALGTGRDDTGLATETSQLQQTLRGRDREAVPCGTVTRGGCTRWKEQKPGSQAGAECVAEGAGPSCAQGRRPLGPGPTTPSGCPPCGSVRPPSVLPAEETRMTDEHMAITEPREQKQEREREH